MNTHTTDKPPRLLVTPGDAAGIGPEIALRACALREEPSEIIYVGPQWLWEEAAAYCETPVPGACMPVPGLDDIPSQKPIFGRVSPVWGRVAMECVRVGAEACLAGEADALVTAPLTKEGIHAAGYTYKGHTDFLADITRTPRHAMMLSSGAFRVILVTHHIALREVLDTLTSTMIYDTLLLAHETCCRLGETAPRIAVCGINPHAGEAGAFGREEIDSIIPACEKAREEGIDAVGPLSSDSLFHHVLAGKYACVVAMYHDQGLIPIKMHGFDDVVNTTLGLPLVRTSPGHGSAYDIAGTRTASPHAMRAALDHAARLSSQRSVS